jgi:hypothetical protein
MIRVKLAGGNIDIDKGRATASDRVLELVLNVAKVTYIPTQMGMDEHDLDFAFYLAKMTGGEVDNSGFAATTKGGPGSGNFGHAGRPGKWGGSAPKGGGETGANPFGWDDMGVDVDPRHYSTKTFLDFDTMNDKTNAKGYWIDTKGKLIADDYPPGCYHTIIAARLIEEKDPLVGEISQEELTLAKKVLDNAVLENTHLEDRLFERGMFKVRWGSTLGHLQPKRADIDMPDGSRSSLQKVKRFIDEGKIPKLKSGQWYTLTVNGMTGVNLEYAELMTARGIRYNEDESISVISGDIGQDVKEYILKALKGGKGSGFWGHSGRPGKWGGSAPAGGESGLDAEMPYRGKADNQVKREGIVSWDVKKFYYGGLFITTDGKPVGLDTGHPSAAGTILSQLEGREVYDNEYRALDTLINKYGVVRMRISPYSFISLQCPATITRPQARAVMKLIKDWKGAGTLVYEFGSGGDQTEEFDFPNQLATATLKGGPGSGFYGHAGRPGKWGGSAPQGGETGYLKVALAPGKATYFRKDTWDLEDKRASDMLDEGLQGDSRVYSERRWNRFPTDAVWPYVNDAERGKIKDGIIKGLADQVGLSYGDTNDLIHVWAKTSNNSDESIMLQMTAAEVFGTKLSKWQTDVYRDDLEKMKGDSERVEIAKQRVEVSGLYIDAIKKDSKLKSLSKKRAESINDITVTDRERTAWAKEYADKMDAIDKSVAEKLVQAHGYEGYVANLIVTRSGVRETYWEGIMFGKNDGMERLRNYHKTAQKTVDFVGLVGGQYKKILPAIYRNTQKAFAAKGLGPDDMITLFRGVKLGGNGSSLAKTGAKVVYHGNVLESWSVSYSVAKDFAKGSMGRVVCMKIPVRNILCTSRTGFGCLSEGEYVVIDNIPGAHGLLVEGEL